MKKNTLLFILTAVFAMVGFLGAATLSYSPLVPQTSDSALIIANKAAVSSARLAAGNSYSNITTATTTSAKSGAGVLVRVIVNTVGAGSTLTIYDNTAASGTKIATMTTAIQCSQEFNVAFATGLTVVSASGSPADITLVYR